MLKNIIKKILLLLIAAAMFAVFIPSYLYSWGVYGHKKINRMAVFTLPPQMIGFYKKHIEYITEHGIDPDRRKFADEKEAVRHYIDIDHYGDKPFDVMPKKWKDAVAKYTEDTLNLYGINPWWTEKMYFKLIEAFKNQDVDKILYISASLGHYIADACVPLHNTQYYDGKFPEQKGVHSFWESRIPELFGDDYNFFVGQAEYLEKPLDKIWDNIKLSFAAIDTIYMVQEKMNSEFSGDKKYTFESRGQTTVQVFSKEYSQQFSKLLNGMVERQMRRAVKTLGSFWYTAWINAGQPDLSKIEDKDISDAHKKELEEQENLWKTGKAKGRSDPE
jgi:hypothetical protein